MSLIGAHVSTSGGVDKAPANAKTQGCEVMQIFVQPPQTYKTPETTPEEVQRFQFALKECQIQEVYVHTPYLINLASTDNRIRYGSINLIRRNLERSSQLGCKYLMTHLGSYAGGSKEEGLKKVKEGLVKVLKGYHGKCTLLLELSAGCGNIIGSRFEEIHKLLTVLKHFKLAVCLDTAHIFASGYDLRTKEAIDKTLEMFDSTIGFSYLQLIHLNDSLTKLGSKKDRHANIGDGEIGVKGCELLLNHPYLKNINFILETPGEENRRFKDIEMLKRLRK